MADGGYNPQIGENDWSAAKRVVGSGKLSVIMPAFRLGDQIAGNIRRVCNVFSDKVDFEIIAVDDGSGDSTAEEISSVAKEDRRIIPLILAENGGKGNALRRGFQKSTGDFVLLLDADLDLAPEKTSEFFEVMERERADVVIGSKRHPDSDIDYPASRRIASAVYYAFVRMLVGLPVTDTQTGMKLFKRETLKYAFDRVLVKRFAFDIETLAIAREHGAKIAEAPIKMDFGDKIGALNFANVKSVIIDTLAVFYRLRVIKYYRNVELSAVSDPPPQVSVVIACPARSEYLDECMAALALQTMPPLEVIVIPDEDGDFAYDVPFDVRVLPSGRIRPAEKRNAGIRAAKGDIVAFLDDDTAPQPQWLMQAVRHFSREDVGAAGGPAISAWNDSRMALLGGRVYESPLVSGSCRYRYVQERFRYVDDLPSCNLLVRTRLLEKIKGYNTRYWPGEDTILCLDIVNTGAKIVYDPFAVVYHHRRALFGPHLRQVGRYAYHRGFFARVFPQTSLRIAYMLPSFFVAGLVGGAAICALSWNSQAYAWHAVRAVYFAAVAFYAVATFLASFMPKPIDWITVWIGTVATHVTYGVRFAAGLFFGHMPAEVRRFDHPSETTTKGTDE